MKFPKWNYTSYKKSDLQQFPKGGQTDLFLFFMKVTLMDILIQDQKETVPKNKQWGNW